MAPRWRRSPEAGRTTVIGGDLGDALSRLRRRDELLRRISGRDSVVDEAVTAVRRVVERHPELSITLTVRSPDGTAIVDVTQHEGQVRVDVTRGDGSAAGAPSDGRHGTDDVGSHPAVRLAAMLRDDPYLLYNRRPED